MFNRQLRTNIKQLDLQIGILTKELYVLGTDDETEYEMKVQKMEDLTKLRCQLAESKVKDSHAGVLITGAFGIVGTLIVLHYEKTDVVTSKAFGMVKMFKGG